ncbi:MAG: response regulator [Flavobacterium micromati]|jgi:DNA-binding response OmpR family regulator|nr:response regulator [Flavobacterium micromati]
MKKILIIEDENSIREAIAELLTLNGYLTFQAINGLDGLVKVQLEEPDLILCDLMMPKVDGYEFLKQHMNSSHKSIPVLLLTAKGEREDQYKGLELGAKEYIKKPFAFSLLKKAIEWHLSRS